MVPLTVKPSLRRYLEEQVLPRYRDCDAAHDLRHIEAVIENSLEIARELRGRYALDIDMVYAIAAYHDIGIPQGRADHHLTSAAALRADCRLRQWFSPPQIETMAQAVEDHRASAKERPRSIYGEIVSEADRTLDPETVVRRTVLYGLDHCTQLDFDGQYARAWEHLRGKYGPGGINLIFFLPIAAVSIFIHVKNKMIDYKFALKCAPFGIAGAFLGVWVAGMLSPRWVGKAFAVLVLILGIKELFSKTPPKEKDTE